jgi:hypothetical protein
MTNPDVERAIQINDQKINNNLSRGLTQPAASTREPVKGDTIAVVEKWEYVKKWLQQ